MTTKTLTPTDLEALMEHSERDPWMSAADFIDVQEACLKGRHYTPFMLLPIAGPHQTGSDHHQMTPIIGVWNKQDVWFAVRRASIKMLPVELVKIEATDLVFLQTGHKLFDTVITFQGGKTKDWYSYATVQTIINGIPFETNLIAGIRTSKKMIPHICPYVELTDPIPAFPALSKWSDFTLHVERVARIGERFHKMFAVVADVLNAK